jgi:hypothetical protein
MMKIAACLLVLLCIQARAQNHVEEASVCVDSHCHKGDGFDELVDAEQKAKAINAIVKQRTFHGHEVTPKELKDDDGVMVKVPSNSRDKNGLVSENGSGLKRPQPSTDDASTLKSLNGGVPVGNARVRPSRHGIKVNYEDNF